MRMTETKQTEKEKPFTPTPTQVNRIVTAMRAIGLEEWAGYAKTMLSGKTFEREQSRQVASKMTSTMYCVVGEAYNYTDTDAYKRCEMCDLFSRAFLMINKIDENGMVRIVDPDLDKRKLLGFLLGFVMHWERKHFDRVWGSQKIKLVQSIRYFEPMLERGDIKLEVPPGWENCSYETILESLWYEWSE